MRVAYVCADPGVPAFGCKGCSIHVQEILRALIKRGTEVDLFATRTGNDIPHDLKSLRVHQLPHQNISDPATREQSAITANRNLQIALQENAPFDLVYQRYSLWSYAGMEYACAAGIPGLLEVNAPLIDEQANHRGLIHRDQAEEVARRAFGAASALIAVSQPVADYLKRFPIDHNSLHVVSNGVDPSRFPELLPATIPAESNTFTIGFVGTLKPWHGLSILLKAFFSLSKKNPNYRLLIVGDGPEREKLMAELSTQNSRIQQAVRFTGAVLPAEIPGMLASMDVAVAPYPQMENFYFSPLKIYEYMAAGLPVVVSRLDGLDQFIQDGVHGLFCLPGDANSLATAIDRLHNSPQELGMMGEAGRKTVRENHTWDLVLQRIFQRAGIEHLLEPSYLETRDP